MNIPNMPAGFGATHVPGIGFVQATGGQRSNGLGDEAAVMMISGLGSSMDADGKFYPLQIPKQKPGAAQVKTGSVAGGAGSALITEAPVGLMAQLSQAITLGTITLPLWAWLLISAGLGAAGGYWAGSKK